jgi:hypothetical protein
VSYPCSEPSGKSNISGQKCRDYRCPWCQNPSVCEQCDNWLFSHVGPNVAKGTSLPKRRCLLTLYDTSRVTRGLCYDHNFLRFSTLFGEKYCVFLKNQCYDHIFAKTRSSLSKKRQHFRQIFRRKYCKNHNIGPRLGQCLSFGHFKTKYK